MYKRVFLFGIKYWKLELQMSLVKLATMNFSDNISLSR